MASVKNILTDWTGDRGPRHDLYNSTKGLVLRWLNEAQLRFCDRSESLRGLWEPILGDDGVSELPEDFLREFVGRVKWSDSTHLGKGDYHTLRLSDGGTVHSYAIYGGSFYVFAPTAGSPTVPYVKKPAEITANEISAGDLEIPTEFHHDMITFLDAMFARRDNDIQGYNQLLQVFDARCVEAGVRYQSRSDAPLMMRGGTF